MNTVLIPNEIRLTCAGRELEIRYVADVYVLTAEYLRVFSPSAEVRGHSNSWKIVPGKLTVVIKDIEAVGQYAVRLIFSDGHNSGIYTWAVLHDLATHQKEYWQRYLFALSQRNLSREVP